MRMLDLYDVTTAPCLMTGDGTKVFSVEPVITNTETEEPTDKQHLHQPVMSWANKIHREDNITYNKRKSLVLE